MITRMSAYYMALLVILTTIMVVTRARELRPSYHGLEYQMSSAQTTGAKSSPPEMKAFFRANSTSSSSSSSKGGSALPRAMNSNDKEWWRRVGGGGGGDDHLRHVLLLVSVVCGVAGAVLFAASAVVCFVRRDRSSNPHREIVPVPTK